MITVELKKRFEVEVDLKVPGQCLPALYTNGQGFEVQIPSGQPYEAPQITVTEVDGDFGQQAANTPVVCQWVPVLLNNTAGVTLGIIAQFPNGAIFILGNISLDDNNITFGEYPMPGVITLVGQIASALYENQQLIITPVVPSLADLWVNQRVRNSQNNDVAPTVSSPTTIIFTDDVKLTDDNGTVDQYPSPTEVKIDGVVDSSVISVSGVWTVKVVAPPPPTPTAIAPYPILVTQKTSYDVGDEGWRLDQGEFEMPVGNYLAVQQLARSAAIPFVTLKHALPEVGVNRFTDTDDNPLAYADPSPANGIVKDWLTRKMYAVNRQFFTESAPLDPYQTALDAVTNASFSGFDGWRMPTKEEIETLFDLDNSSLLSNINGHPPGFNTLSLVGISTATTNPLASTQCWRVFGNGTRQGSFANKSVSPCLTIMVRDF